MLRITHILTLVGKSNDKDPKFKVGDYVRISKYKNIFAKGYILQIGLKKYLWLKNLKLLYHGNMLLIILMVKKLLERFMKKNCRRQIKEISYISNGTVMIILLVVG